MQGAFKIYSIFELFHHTFIQYLHTSMKIGRVRSYFLIKVFRLRKNIARDEKKRKREFKCKFGFICTFYWETFLGSLAGQKDAKGRRPVYHFLCTKTTWQSCQLISEMFTKERRAAKSFRTTKSWNIHASKKIYTVVDMVEPWVGGPGFESQTTLEDFSVYRKIWNLNK